MLTVKPGSFLVRVRDREVEVSYRALEILRIVRSKGTLKEAARELGISYRGVIGIVRKLERELGERVVITRRGRGSRARLTMLGEEMLEAYISSKAEALSARNRIQARILSIVREGASAIIVAETMPSIVKVLITSEALEELGIGVGDQVDLVIKASNIVVMTSSKDRAEGRE
jgi:molybdate transport system regulatory protein